MIIHAGESWKVISKKYGMIVGTILNDFNTEAPLPRVRMLLISGEMQRTSIETQGTTTVNPGEEIHLRASDVVFMEKYDSV